MNRQRFTTRGLELSYLDSAPGDRQRPVALLLHGFPDAAAMWQPQIDALHANGYRCIAPDTVGCGESQIATTRADYNVLRIVADVVALLDHLRLDEVDVVGHDWGAVQAWLLAARHPQRVRRLVALSVGHPMAYARAGTDQKIAGWYIAFFLLAGLSERLLSGEGRLSLRRVFASHPQMDEVLHRLRAPGRLTAALRIYRASLVTALFTSHPAVAAPTLGIWSRGDRFLVESQMAGSARYVTGPWTYRETGGGHWIPIEQPDWLNRQLLSFLA